jgi:tetratricopeptide (TPR) repeat protein
MKLYQEEEKALRPIHTGNATWTYRLAMTLMRQSILQQVWGNLSSAIETTRQAEELLQQVVKQNPTNQNWTARLYQSSVRELELQLPDQTSQKRLAELVELTNKIEALSLGDAKNSTLAYLYSKSVLAQVPYLAHIGQREQANEKLNSVVEKLQKMHDGRENDAIYASTMAELLLARAELFTVQSKHEIALNDCELAASILSVPAKNTADFTLLALQVRAHVCLGTSDTVKTQIALLEQMGYKENRYLQYISNHQRKKGMQ